MIFLYTLLNSIADLTIFLSLNDTLLLVFKRTDIPIKIIAMSVRILITLGDVSLRLVSMHRQALTIDEATHFVDSEEDHQI